MFGPLSRLLPSLPSLPSFPSLPPLPALPARRNRDSRRWWVRRGRAHIEVRGLHRIDAEALVSDLETALRKVAGVDWAAVNAVLGRVVVDLAGGDVPIEALVATIDAVEDRHQMSDERFLERPEHPGDVEPLQRQLIMLGADLAGLSVSVAGKIARSARLPLEIAALVPLVEHTPRLRSQVESLLGWTSAEMSLALVNALAQGLAQGPIGLIIDAAHRMALVGEVQARRRVWKEREAELCSGRQRCAPIHLPPRPASLPRGPVERYGDHAGLVGLAAGGTAFAATGDLRQTAAFLAASAPKAARLTRECFAAELTRVLGERRVLVVDGDALRRLDRIDTVVIDARVLHTAQFVAGPLVALDGATETEGRLRQRVGVLLEPEAPRVLRRSRVWALGPLAAVAPGVPAAAQTAARRVRRPGSVVLGLTRHGTLQAILAAEPGMSPLAGALLSAARAAGELLIAGNVAGVVRRLSSGRMISSGTRLSAEIRELQAEGRVVALVSAGPGAALAAADCGIGILAADRTPPWGAHVLCGPGLAEACFLLDSIATAATVSRRGVQLAAYGSVTGALLALGGPRASATERAVLGVNGAAGVGLVSGIWSARALARRPAPVVSDTAGF
ncbi:hypothetical protein ABN034_31840 [Actinopolymorpha sp. B11F2]|uniref:hypothetical protein n=1 Tax=Actinopolymorpha sp. B11F2 TaxID=3160862 RepID=UPI0032E3C465